MNDFIHDMFINEAKPALNRHSGGGGGGNPNPEPVIPETIILVDEAGNECAAVLSSEVIDLTATVNDIREGKTAVTENGIEVGTLKLDGGSIPETIILVDENGTEYAAALTDEPVELTATANDIREGETAVTENGIEVGTLKVNDGGGLT